MPYLPVFLVLVGAAGCSSSTADHEFISDNPNDSESSGDLSNGDGSGVGGGSSGEGGGGGGGSVAPEDPERLIAEADVVQIDGDTLYALSRYSGLTVVDIADPTALAIIGRKKLGGEPFEMYREGDVIYAMFRNWGHFDEGEFGYEWITTSHIEALDVSNPAAITTIGAHEVPGNIIDSRKVGDVIYTVSFEDGYCYDCDLVASTTVTSLDTSSPGSFDVVDQLKLVDSNSEHGYTRSISVTEDRIYVAGVEWSDGASDGSTIDVVDISDPGGELERGTTVPVDGQITNRWQIDEYEGVLRVISQPWDSSVFPSVQTFQIASSNQISPLGETVLTLPQPESLRAVRFDGERAYAITAEQIDPLFTIDLSDPAHPAQRGELEIPGFIAHIEPRGDRLLTLGFDNQSTEGGLHVSLFDVSDMTAPRLIRRIGFGGEWGDFAEDQDRLHKAFKIMPDLGLLAVPFSAWTYNDYGCSTYDSGIQLIDWSNDDLVERGVAPVRGDARRAFVHGGSLFALSDEQLRAYDIRDRGAPEKVGELALSTHVSQVVVSGDVAVRLAADWWTNEPRIEIVSANDPGAESPLGGLNLGPMLSDVEADQGCYGWGYWNVRMFVHESTVSLVWPSWNSNEARIATVDISDPAAPKLLAHVDLPVDTYGYSSYGSEVVAAGDTVVQVGDKLVFQQIFRPTNLGLGEGYGDGDDGLEEETSQVLGGFLFVLDLSNPTAPHLSHALPLPPGAGHTGLVAQGSDVLFSHWVALDDEDRKAKFFFDRIDFSGGAAALHAPINVPGSLVNFDRDSGHVLTVDYERVTTMSIKYPACYEQFGYGAEWEPVNGDYEGLGTCVGIARSLKVVAIDEESAAATLLDTKALPKQNWISNLLVGEDRAFFTGMNYDYETGESSSDIWIVGGVRAGALELRKINLAETWWAAPAAVEGQKLLALSWPGAAVAVDSADLDAVDLQMIEEIPYAVEHVTLAQGRALLSLGAWGLHVVTLD